MTTRNNAISRRLIVVLALGGLALLSPVIAARWTHADRDTTLPSEIRQDNKIATEPATFEYFPAQYRNQSQRSLPEPHIQAF